MQAQPTPPDFAHMDGAQIAAEIARMWHHTQDLENRLQTADTAYQTLNTNYNTLQGQHSALQSQVNAVQPTINMPPPTFPANFTQQITQHLQPQPRTSDPKAAKPEPYKGERGAAARGFIQSCELYFLLRPGDFPDHPSKIRFTVMLFQDKAARWTQPIVQEIIAGTNVARTTTWARFRAEFEAAFFDPDEKRTAARRLQQLHQTKSTAEYASEFRELIAILGWTEESQLMNTFYVGLKPHVKDEISKTDDLTTLKGLVDKAIKIDNRHWSREKEKKEDSPSKPTPRPTPRYDPPKSSPAPAPTPHWSSTAPGPAPMDLSATNSRTLTPQEKKRRFDLGLCLYCGANDHKRSGCPALKKAGGAALARAAAIRATEEETQEESGKGDSL